MDRYDYRLGMVLCILNAVLAGLYYGAFNG